MLPVTLSSVSEEVLKLETIKSVLWFGKYFVDSDLDSVPEKKEKNNHMHNQ